MKKEKNIKISYNPFMMWGSWVGAVLFIILCLMINIPFITNLADALAFKTVSQTCPYGDDGEACAMWRSGSILSWLNGYDSEMNSVIATYSLMFSFIYGFLIGYAIHSLFRYTGNKKIRSNR